MIGIIDLHIGNLANVKKALDGQIIKDPYGIARADKIVLPGVGNIGAVLEKLSPVRDVVIDKIEEGTPILGICLGMQLLFERSEESEGDCLGVLQGKSVEFQTVRTPHIGWNQVSPVRNCPLLAGISQGSYFYFVHSFYVVPEEKEVVAGVTEYLSKENVKKFPSVIWKNNIYGTQFHPEKSSSKGLEILQNFKEL